MNARFNEKRRLIDLGIACLKAMHNMWMEKRIESPSGGGGLQNSAPNRVGVAFGRKIKHP